MEKETISKMDKTPAKSSGMPLFAKIILVIFALGLAGFMVYDWYDKPTETPTSTQSVSKPLFTKGQVMIAKCHTLDDISLYLETDITADEFNNILLAVSTINPDQLVIPGQELSFNSNGKRLVVYGCCYSKNILMGKVKYK